MSISKKKIIHYLSTTSKGEINKLFSKANALTEKLYQNKIHFRGIIEFSNICEKNCCYCGLRKDLKIDRYQMTKEDILKCAKFCSDMGYGSIVLQSGELTTDKRLEFLINIISTIKKKYNLGMTLSLGELPKESLKELFKAGGHRYLLRIETSNEKLYKKLHPNDKNHSFQNRLNALENLKSLGYQVGTGVMIGLPFQTYEDLANDILFFKDFDVDMLGMGPYVPHPKTPLYKSPPILKDNFTLSLKMVALSRLVLKDVNIAATTALQVFDKQGREKALLAGANILMPIVTPTDLRKNYLIYPDKPCVEDTKEKCFNCITGRLKSIKKEMGQNNWGDSKHFYRRTKK
ncbi:MAG: [FeFe] hydrogenase maturase subunit HydE [Candidatus Anoxychlamydiales bacterium]|nr:[FeFe] hydrogenase maturase subunit HydE [Candidatus Anoxychlamydiales bacterium]NGX35714.1 [FeFe] hydrogenase maturase subunit HydE [Candidatus Anoxychlamydiales bacterium]